MVFVYFFWGLEVLRCEKRVELCIGILRNYIGNVNEEILNGLLGWIISLIVGDDEDG